jgi:hypothetical protein
LVKTVELSTIQLSLVGILYCTIPYVTYCFGLALLPNQINPYMSNVTLPSPSNHLSYISLFISCHSLYPISYHISDTVKKTRIKSVQSFWYWGPAMFTWSRAPSRTIHLGHNNHFKPLSFILGSSIGGQPHLYPLVTLFFLTV